MRNDFSTRLVQLRRKKQISQEILANDLQVTRGCITNWECGKRQPRPVQLEQIAEYFHVTVDYLLGRDIKENIDVLEEQVSFWNILDISMLDAESKIAIINYYQYLKGKNE